MRVEEGKHGRLWYIILTKTLKQYALPLASLFPNCDVGCGWWQKKRYLESETLLLCAKVIFAEIINFSETNDM